MGATHATPAPVYHSHAKTNACVDDWRNGFAVDLERFVLLPRELLPIIAAYAIPNFSDIISCQEWIGAGLFDTIPIRVEPAHDSGGYARARYEFSWAVTRAGDPTHETPSFFARRIDGFTLCWEILPLVRRQFQPAKGEVALSSLLRLMAGWTDETDLNVGVAAATRTDPLWLVVDQNVAVVQRKASSSGRMSVPSIAGGDTYDSTFAAARWTYLIASRHDTTWSHVLRLEFRTIRFDKRTRVPAPDNDAYYRQFYVTT